MAGEKDDTEKTGLRPAQVIASALAAVTAAFLGSTLGVAGTITGAGIASVITTIGGDVYLRSMRRGREAARKTALVLSDTRLRQETRFAEPARPAPANPLVKRRPAEQNPPPVDDPYRTLPLTPDVPSEHKSEPDEQPARSWWKKRWVLVAGTSVVAFVIGMLALTGLEKATGHPVSGGSGTTFGQVVGRSDRTTPPTAPETATVTETPSPQQTRTSAPSATDENTPSQAPTQQQQQLPPTIGSEAPSEAPSLTPTANPTPSP